MQPLASLMILAGLFACSVQETPTLSCQEEDKSYPVGSIYFIQGCLLHKCVQGSGGNLTSEFIERNCRNGDLCYPVLSEYNMNGCNRCACTNATQDLPYISYPMKCFENGRMYDPGSKYFAPVGCELQHCFEYEPENVRVEHIEYWCQFNGECHPVGHTYQTNVCELHVCNRNTNGTVGYVLHHIGPRYDWRPLEEMALLHGWGILNTLGLQLGCQEGNKCYPVGSTYFIRGCRLHQCSQGSDGNLTSVLIERDCRNSDMCYPELPEYNMNGCDRCACTNATQNWPLQHYRNCFENNIIYPPGSKYFAPVGCELQHCLEYVPENVGPVHIEYWCQLNGVCHPVGHMYQTNVCELYICTRNTDDTVGYVLQDIGCQLNGVCYLVGHTYQTNVCELYVCNRNTDGTVGYVLEDIGTNACCVSGVAFQNGQTLTLPGGTGCMQCSQGQATVVTEGCED